MYKPPTNLSVPSVLISKSVAAVSITNKKEAPKLLAWLGSVGSEGLVVTILGKVNLPSASLQVKILPA